LALATSSTLFFGVGAGERGCALFGHTPATFEKWSERGPQRVKACGKHQGETRRDELYEWRHVQLRETIFQYAKENPRRRNTANSAATSRKCHTAQKHDCQSLKLHLQAKSAWRRSVETRSRHHSR
jgi:hypothetical protein